MKKITLSARKKFVTIEVPKPVITKPDEVLLRINSVGVCGSDMHYYSEGKIGDQVIDFPFTIGHECSAVVEEIGTAVKRVSIGDLVAVEPALSCHQCEQCQSGREHTCTDQKFLGCPGQIEGCLAEYIVMPEANCFPVPGNITPEQAMLIEPLSIGYYATKFINEKSNNKKIGILGAGPIGLSVLLSLKARGNKNIFVTDKLDYRLSAAKNAGAMFTANAGRYSIPLFVKENLKHQLDAVFECCGRQEALDDAIDILKPGGKLFIIGIPEVDRISFDISKIRRKEITIQNIRRQNKSIQDAIDLTASGKWDPDFMLTHRFTPEKTNEAFETVNSYSNGVIKALIQF